MPVVHLLNPMADACGGSENRTASLFSVLADFGDVILWALAPDRSFYGRVPFRLVDEARGAIPRGGVLVVVGAYFQIPAWVRAGRFERVVLIYNIRERPHILHALSTLERAGIDTVEVIAASQALADDLAEIGIACRGIEPSWIDVGRFHPPSTSAERPFTVGRMSRDVPDKFHEEDPALFRRLADSGVPVRIMGGTHLAGAIGSHPLIELLPSGAVPAPDFLQTLDVFLYRTSATWFETYGRAIAEAMASGAVPVVHARGGYTDFVTNELNGFVFETSVEAFERVCRLQANPDLRGTMAAAARSAMEALYGLEARQRLAVFYFCGNEQPR